MQTHQRWSNEEVNLLKELYPVKTTSELLEHINRTENAILKKAKSLRLKKDIKAESIYWTYDETILLVELYPISTISELLLIFRNRDIESISSKAKSLKLSKAYSNVWKQDEINYLKENFKNFTYKEIAIYLNKSLESVKMCISKYGLTKMVKLDLSYEACLNTAKQYKTKTDLRNNHPHMVETAINNGWYDAMCEHMTNYNFSSPQLICQVIFDTILKSESLYNTRKIIKPYELDIYYPKLKFAIEYNGTKWHSSEEVIIRDKIKNSICKEKEIFMYTILQNGISDKYESDIKTFIINDLELLNNYLNTSITKEDIENVMIDISSKILNIPEISEICLSYSNYTKWKTENMSMYYKLLRSGNLKKYTSHMSRCRKVV